MKPQFKNPLFLLALITIFAAITHIWNFWGDWLHVDEKYTLWLVNQDLWGVVWYSLNNDCNPPLFYIFAWISSHIFGFTPFAVRLPSVICSILLIPAIYILGREYRGETLGLMAALGTATLGSIWYYSQFGRAYMLQCLLFALLCIFLVRLIRGESRPYHWVAASVLSALIAFTHLFAIIPLACIWLYLIYQYRIKGLKWVSVTAMLSSPLVLLLIAILKWRLTSRDNTDLNWYGATFNQLIVFAPLEFFSYNFVFWIPLVTYATWIYRKMREVTVIIFSSVVTYLALLAVCDMTPVFLRYLMMFVPIWITVGLLPVADFIDSPDHTHAQKFFVIGSFALFYFCIVFFAFLTGLYPSKGYYFDITE